MNILDTQVSQENAFSVQRVKIYEFSNYYFAMREIHDICINVINIIYASDKFQYEEPLRFSMEI